MGGSQRGNHSSPSTQITLAMKGLKEPPESGLLDVKLTLTIAPEVTIVATGAKSSSVRASLGGGGGSSSHAGSLSSSHAASKMVAKTIEVKVVGRVVDAAVAREIEGVAAGASNRGSPSQVGRRHNATHHLHLHRITYQHTHLISHFIPLLSPPLPPFPEPHR